MLLDLLVLEDGVGVGDTIELTDTVAFEAAAVEEADVATVELLDAVSELDEVWEADVEPFGFTLVSSPLLSIHTPLPESQHEVAFTPQQ